MVKMDLWKPYRKAAVGEYGGARLLLSTGERKYTSLNMVNDRGLWLDHGKGLVRYYDEGNRYVLAKDINHDLLITIYEVNTGVALIIRISRDIVLSDWTKIEKVLGSWKGPNIEIRVLGFQNLDSWAPSIMEEIKRHVKGKLMEADLYGTDLRHIAFDLKTGVMYNLLLENRIYRAGELACKVTKEEFDKTRSDLALM